VKVIFAKVSAFIITFTQLLKYTMR